MTGKSCSDGTHVIGFTPRQSCWTRIVAHRDVTGASISDEWRLNPGDRWIISFEGAGTTRRFGRAFINCRRVDLSSSQVVATMGLVEQLVPSDCVSPGTRKARAAAI
jgi:hypothetical protein